MRKLAVALGLCALVLVMAGCTTVTGDWTLKKITPPSARGQFDMSRVVFNADGTYDAVFAGQGEGNRARGTYQFEPRSRLLTLTTADGRKRRYSADRCDMCGYMAVSSADQPGTWEAILTPTRK